MFLLGLDAGTTTISGVLLNIETEVVECIVSVEHEAAFSSDNPDLSIQDPEKILRTARRVKEQLLQEARRRGGDRAVSAMSVTGQVHGILYIDKEGRSLSPLYTWQDLRGRKNHPAAGVSWSAWATERTGYVLPTGYGFLTHVINRHEMEVPGAAAGVSTILGYVTMRLADAPTPSLEYTDAQSLGLFDLKRLCFDAHALELLGISERYVPTSVPAGTLIGKTEEGIPVYAAVGDNQAGFIGAVRGNLNDLVVNVGTSAQISACLPTVPAEALEYPHAGWFDELEIRPFPGKRYVITGASLSGGSSYRLLEQLFREICRKYTNIDPGNIFDLMNEIPYDRMPSSLRLDVRSQFLGTRKDPETRGAISNIGRYNLTHDYLVEGFLRGIAEEVARYYRQIIPLLDATPHRVVGVGNALRRNPLLKRILEEEIGVPVLVPRYTEEAACGAAYLAGIGAGLITQE